MLLIWTPPPQKKQVAQTDLTKLFQIRSMNEMSTLKRDWTVRNLKKKVETEVKTEALFTETETNKEWNIVFFNEIFIGQTRSITHKVWSCTAIS